MLFVFLSLALPLVRCAEICDVAFDRSAALAEHALLQAIPRDVSIAQV